MRITPDSARVLRLYRHYKNGFLPVAGGVLDQTNQFLQAMEIIESAVAEWEAKQRQNR